MQQWPSSGEDGTKAGSAQDFISDSRRPLSGGVQRFLYHCIPSRPCYPCRSGSSLDNICSQQTDDTAPIVDMNYLYHRMRFGPLLHQGSSYMILLRSQVATRSILRDSKRRCGTCGAKSQKCRYVCIEQEGRTNDHDPKRSAAHRKPIVAGPGWNEAFSRPKPVNRRSSCNTSWSFAGNWDFEI